MKLLNKGDILYWARIIPHTGIYEVNELKIRTIEDTYVVGVDKRNKQAYLFGYDSFDDVLFEDRTIALHKVQEAEKNKNEFEEIEYEEY